MPRAEQETARAFRVGLKSGNLAILHFDKFSKPYLFRLTQDNAFFTVFLKKREVVTGLSQGLSRKLSQLFLLRLSHISSPISTMGQLGQEFKYLNEKV